MNKIQEFLEQLGKPGTYQVTLKKCEMTLWKAGEMLLLSWMDETAISMIPTVHSAEMAEVISKFGKT
jgi:hypothetical protein